MGRIEILERNLGYVDENRKVLVYLPEGYDEGEKRYPVVYMHDGQNVFTNEGAFGGCSWGVKETLEAMEQNGETDGIIVVGVDNNGERRFEDYSPWKNTIGNAGFTVNTRGGDGALYTKFLVDDLKPWIDAHYRTLPDYDHTAVCGSSMGGLLSAYMAAAKPEVFGCAGVFSSASWFAREEFNDYIGKSAIPASQKYFVQVGTNETVSTDEPSMPQLFIDVTLEYVETLLKKGIPCENLRLKITAGGIHNEAVWREYMGEFFRFFIQK